MNVKNVGCQLMLHVLNVMNLLVNDHINKDDGTTVQISKCPNDHGKIKSPICCGQDMSCSNLVI